MTVDTPPAVRRTFYGWYVVTVLMLCQTLAALDSKLPYILVEALKQDLNLSDTQIGLLTGPAFSLTYAIAAIPISKLSDRGVRVHIITGAIVAWSALTAVGGFALGFMTLVLSRTGVAIGEAALLPASHSIIADYTDKASRPKAIAIYSLGMAIGTFMAFSLGGYLNDRFGWRATLFIVGASGVIVSLLVFFTVREPERDKTGGAREAPKGDILSLFRNKRVRNLISGGTLVGVGSGAMTGWAPAYIMRTFDLTATETGATYGPLAGAVGITGILCGGFIAGWFAQRAPHKTFYLLAIFLLIAMVAQIGSLLTGSYPLFMVLSAVSILLLACYLAPTFATVQSVVDPAARSFAAAVTLFCINGVGFALGAFFCGWVSDLLNPYYGANSLKIALLILSVFLFWSAIHYVLVARHLTDAAEAKPAS